MAFVLVVNVCGAALNGLAWHSTGSSFNAFLFGVNATMSLFLAAVVAFRRSES